MPTLRYLDGLVAPTLPKMSFGLWGLLNTGADPFGAAVRQTGLPEDAISCLGDCGVTMVSFHDSDVGLDPWTTDPATISDRRELLRQTLDAANVRVHMFTPNLFSDPMLRAGALTNNSEAIRTLCLQRILTAVDNAEFFGASWLTLWLGRDGAEVDALIDPAAAYLRIADALTVICRYIQMKGYKVRISLEPKPNEPRGHIYVATTGAALGIIGMLPKSYQGMVFVNPELLQHEGMAGLNSCHALGQLVAADKLAFLHLGGQTSGRFDMDMPFGGGNSCLKSSFYVALGVVMHAPDCVREFDCHPFRTETGPNCLTEFVQANLMSWATMEHKAEEFLANAEVQEILDDSQAQGFSASYKPAVEFDDFIAEVRGLKLDPAQISASTRSHVQLIDMMVTMHLLGM